MLITDFSNVNLVDKSVIKYIYIYFGITYLIRILNEHFSRSFEKFILHISTKNVFCTQIKDETNVDEDRN